MPEDGELKLGIDKPNTVTNDYININYVHLFYLGEETAVAIDGVPAGVKSQNGIYSITGQKLQNMQRGINIVDGKKVLVK